MTQHTLKYQLGLGEEFGEKRPKRERRAPKKMWGEDGNDARLI